MKFAQVRKNKRRPSEESWHPSEELRGTQYDRSSRPRQDPHPRPAASPGHPSLTAADPPPGRPRAGAANGPGCPRGESRAAPPPRRPPAGHQRGATAAPCPALRTGRGGQRRAGRPRGERPAGESGRKEPCLEPTERGRGHSPLPPEAARHRERGRSGGRQRDC